MFQSRSPFAEFQLTRGFMRKQDIPCFCAGYSLITKRIPQSVTNVDIVQLNHAMLLDTFLDIDSIGGHFSPFITTTLHLIGYSFK